MDQYKQRQAKVLRIWEATINEKDYRVVLGKIICPKNYVQHGHFFFDPVAVFIERSDSFETKFFFFISQEGGSIHNISHLARYSF